MPDLTSLEDVSPYLDRLDELDQETLLRVHDMVGRLGKIRKQEVCTDNYLTFVRTMWPAFIEGKHHSLMARAFEKVARGELKRLIINMPPRHTKSEFASYLLPSWFLGQYPDKKVIQTDHTA